VFVALAARYSRLSRARRIRAARLSEALASARLEALQTQLEPHFLFNTLNAIAELVHKNPNAAEGMVTRLGVLLRRSLSTRHQFEIPLREELELVDAYLDIVRLRFGDRVVITRTIDADALDAFVPVMVL